MELYKLTNQYQMLQSLLTEPLAEGEEGCIEEALLEIRDEIEEKADGYGRVIKNMAALHDALDAEIKRLTDRKRTIANNIARLKANLQEHMEVTGTTKIRTELFTFTVQKNPPKVVIDDMTKLPEKYLIPQPPKADAAAIKAGILDGSIADGAHLEAGYSLRMR